MCVCMCVCVFVGFYFRAPQQRAGCDIFPIFKLSLTGLNSDFSFA